MDIFESARDLTELPNLYDEKKISLPQQLSYNNIKGRKWAQITHVISVMNGTYSGIVDWCCGKGHLGRTLSHVLDVPLQGLDIDEELIIEIKKIVQISVTTPITKCDVLKRRS